MTYEVVVTAAARQNLRDNYVWAAERAWPPPDVNAPQQTTNPKPAE